MKVYECDECKRIMWLKLGDGEWIGVMSVGEWLKHEEHECVWGMEVEIEGEMMIWGEESIT